MVTIYCKLLAQENDINGYITYVFKNLDKASFGREYVMTTRFYNWMHRDIDIGEIGYLTFEEVIAGESKWYDGEKMIPYNYSNIIFIKFVKEKLDNYNKDIII